MKDEEIIESLMEGGNSWAGIRTVDEKGKRILKKGEDGKTPVTKASAQKMDMSKINRKELTKEFIKTFKKLNDIVKKETGQPIWNDFSVVENGSAFNGSSKWLFHIDTDELTITDDEFKNLKPHVGDIDITIPKNRMVDLFNVLLKYEDKKIGNIEYLGNNRANPSEDTQVNAVFKYEIPGSDYIAYPQVDFEPSQYEDDKPTEWDGFAHSSHWDDIKIGLKGVAHKYALNIISQLASKDFKKSKAAEDGQIVFDDDAEKSSAWVATPGAAEAISSLTSADIESAKEKDGNYDEEKLLAIVKKSKKTTRNIRSETGNEPVSAGSYLAFSVGAGLREKYKSVLTSDNKPIKIDGKNVLVPVASSDSEYDTNVSSIFKRLFKDIEPTKENMNKINSFVGLVELISMHNDPELSRRFLKYMVLKKLWGHKPYFNGRSQEIERDKSGAEKKTYPDGFVGTPAQYEDRKVKSGIVNYIIDNLKNGSKLDIDIDEIATSYYETWTGKGGDDIVESFIPFGSKFSKIFEVVEKIGSNK